MNANISYHYINIYSDFSPKVECKDGTIQIEFSDTKDKRLILSLAGKHAIKLADWINYALQDYDIKEMETIGEKDEDTPDYGG